MSFIIHKIHYLIHKIMRNELGKKSKSVKEKNNNNEINDFATVDVYTPLHKLLGVLVQIRRLNGEPCYMYELASEAVKEYLQKHKDVLPANILLENINE